MLVASGCQGLGGDGACTTAGLSAEAPWCPSTCGMAASALIRPLARPGLLPPSPAKTALGDAVIPQPRPSGGRRPGALDESGDEI